MTKLKWDQDGERRYETGASHGVLYRRDNTGDYNKGVVWNGLTTVTETPSGADASPQYADNIKYLNLVAAEDFGGTIEAYTYPREFEACDGSARAAKGVVVGQQTRETFGLSYQTLVGNDIEGTRAGYKIHLVYGALAAPSERAYTTVNDSPEALSFSWEFSTTGAPISLPGFKPTALITIDSTDPDVTPADLKELEDILYGTDALMPRLPTPDEVIAIFPALAS